MSYRTSLAGGAALGVVLALNSGFTAEAATHHKRHHAPVAAKPDRTAELQAEIDELKAEVQSLKSSGESQAAGQAQNDTTALAKISNVPYVLGVVGTGSGGELWEYRRIAYPLASVGLQRVSY